MKSRPLVYGHRGASAYAPENTMPAFRTAARMGADGIELDVRLSRDGVVVVIHDDRLDATTDVSGRVADLSLGELMAADAGVRVAAKWRGTKIPTLSEVLDEFGGRLLLNVELKADVVGGKEAGARLASAVAGLIGRTDLTRRRGLVVSSFDIDILADFAAAAGGVEVPLALIVDKSAGMDPPPIVKLAALHPRYNLVDEALVRRQHEAGRRVNVWTVNSASEARRLSDLGVDGLISDKPDKVKAAIIEPGLPPLV